METLNEIINSWDLSAIQEKKKKKEKTAKDPVFGIAMTWPASDFFGHGHDSQNQNNEEDAEAPPGGGIPMEFGSVGSSDGMFNPGNVGIGTVGGE